MRKNIKQILMERQTFCKILSSTPQNPQRSGNEKQLRNHPSEKEPKETFTPQCAVLDATEGKKKRRHVNEVWTLVNDTVSRLVQSL